MTRSIFSPLHPFLLSSTSSGEIETLLEMLAVEEMRRAYEQIQIDDT